ncbi:AraC family transcriptional regulator [Paenibacillus sp. XY044]|uniref:AraC family transcriptional regulator n=1 Tax=Paenibacillus sp. XY044 TaxID=2026089 RepID=UPI000B9920D1|nr:AraC family transcriptional regulator [Paenibacillus sp. XY044]OZB94216.1 AraC family transcriptional regulator [Paenibacillus sp. XY044]
MKKLDIDRLTRAGVIYFNSKLEMLADLHCKMYRMNTLVSLSTHFHDYYQIWYVSKGEFVHTISNRQYRIRQGDLFLVPPFTLHRVQAFVTEGEILGCEFMPSFINERFADPSGERRFFDAEYLKHFSLSDCTPHSQIVFDGVTDGRIRGLLQDMLGEYEERTPFFEIVLKASLLQLLSIIIRQVNGELVKAGFQKIERYRGTMNKVVEYIDRNAHEDIKLEHICAISNMSKPTICRLFKEWTGKTFNRYLVDLRISNALVLLQRPSMSITDVCYATGFNELAYFCRIFKKYTGISPNQFRKQVLGKSF